ncbi:TonB-dependent receptor [Myroides marinus]|uniref:TonB-dependent receptor n=1 Tax=Myroides marinus TaxID=703342 RepID=UPI000B084768|nr:TonB-dependent receptor [Myroides marinus]MDM1351326.1 TonB-dependent receptor [Myroides marinus]MDM1355993.1 TonB-dependent receptor [Myroides marinus]MDM1358533.1 TonB-dependent receptor [Myroides marinus]MDM1361423.1 TonB-dependent receptor [Myroides marinus]MDM1364180.1 TonB-dependent receptor [Myroides marinus]
MNIKNILFTAFLLISSLMVSYANESVILSGIVKDNTGGSIVGAVIVVKETSQFAQSDVNGKFTLPKLKPLSHYTLIVNYMGFKEYQEVVDLSKGNNIVIKLIPDHYNLNEINIKTKSKVQQVKEKAYNVAVVDATKLHARSMDIGHALSKTSGVRVREQGGMGSNMNISLNGYSGNQIKFFIDGIPMDNFGSSFQLNNIPINLANRIEVYKGVVPVGLGSDALGGAVNIITNTYDKTSLDMSYGYGSFNTHRTNLNFVYADKKSGFFSQLNAYQNYSDNDYNVEVDVYDINTAALVGKNMKIKRFHDRYHNENFVGQVGFINKSFADRLAFGMTLGQSYKEVQTGTRMISVFGKLHQRGNIIMPTFVYEKKNLFTEGLDVRVNANYNLGYDQVIDTVYRRYNWLGDYVDLEEKYGKKGGERNRTMYKYRNNNGMVATVVNYKIGDQHNFSLGNTINFFKRKGQDELDIDNPIKSTPAETTKNITGLSYQFTPNMIWSATVFGKYYNQHIRYTEPYKLSDKWADYGYRKFDANHGYFGYGITGSVFLSDDLQLKASYEKSIRLPSSNELFGDEVNVLGNNKLTPEVSDNYNLGINYNMRFSEVSLVNFDINGFLRNSTDLIFSKLENYDQNRQTFDNLASARNTGIEAEIRYFYKNSFNIGVNATYQNFINTNKYVTGIKSEVYKDRLPNIPYLYGNADINYTINNLYKNDNLMLGYSVFYTKAFYLFWPSFGSKSKGKFEIPDQLVHEFTATYSFGKDKNYQFTFEIHNVFDRKIYDNFSLQKPGRSFNGKFRYFF